MIGAGARNAPLSGGEVVPGEQGCAERLLGLARVEQWMEVWEKVTRLIAQAESINLDRKQVVLSVFHAMERAARACARDGLTNWCARWRGGNPIPSRRRYTT